MSDIQFLQTLGHIWEDHTELLAQLISQQRLGMDSHDSPSVVLDMFIWSHQWS